MVILLFVTHIYFQMPLQQINQEIQHLQSLLKLEKEADFERFRKEIERLSLEEKKEKGLTWHPLLVKKQGFLFGDRAFAILQKSAEWEGPHRFRSGAPVEVYSTREDLFSKGKRKTLKGVLHYVEKNRMKIIFGVEDLPEWLAPGENLLAVDLLFDERTYLEMEKALKALLKAKDDRLAELKNFFYGEAFPKAPAPINIPLPFNYLNESQENAVNNILGTEDIAIIHGPPGTGKTTTLVHAIKMLAATEKNILVTAPSNTAVDLLAERLDEKGLNVVRIGNISRVDEKLLALTLEGRLAEHPENKHIKKVKIEAAEVRKKAKKFKRKFGKREALERRDAYREARELEDWARQLEERLINQMLHNADVIACTFVNSSNSILNDFKFKTIVIDEAGQALQPAAWIPLLRAERVILAGDHCQLPPTVKSVEAQKNGFGKTLLEIGMEKFTHANFLNEQYRMNKQIMGFSNQQFYNGQLIAAEHVADWRLPIDTHAAFEFIDTAGCGFDEKLNTENGSRFNNGEYFIFREHFLQLLKAFEEKQESLCSIAVITPYRAQQLHFTEELAEDQLLNTYLEHLTISTIDGFQGQESDMVYLSLVRSNAKSEIGFLSDYRRMNVALTRARKQLTVIGDSATIGADPFYAAFLEYVEKEGAYRTAWEYMA